VKRGEIWTAASGGGEYGGKPRPVVIIGDDLFADLSSVTICGFTTHATDAPLIRLAVGPTAANGLRQNSWIMIDKISRATVASAWRSDGRSCGAGRAESFEEMPGCESVR